MWFVVLMSVMILVVGGFYLYRGYQARVNIDNTTTISDNSYYTLRGNATAYQKEIYKELSDALNKDVRDDNKAVELVAKNYVADFFTWSNKLRFNDMGGAQYINRDIRKWVYDKALDTFYNDMYYYLEKGQVKDTLEVTDSVASVKNVKFVTEEEHYDSELEEMVPAVEVDAFEVTISWTYKDSSVVSIADFQKEAKIIVIKDSDGLYSIVEVSNGKTQENPEA